MLLRVHQVTGAHAGRVFTFDQPVVRLGRMPDSDVAFDPHADLDASGRHAEVHRKGDQFVLRDSGSRNGTFVNGERVQERLLSNGDVIECGFGGPRVRIELVAPREASGSPVAATEAVPIARPNAPTGAAQALPPVSGDGATAAVPSVVPSGQAETGPMQGPAWGAQAQQVPPSAHPPAQQVPPSAHPPAQQVPPSAHPPAAAGDPANPKQFGQRTVGLMMADAANALLARHESAQRRWKVFAGCLGMLLGVVCLGLAIVLLQRDEPAPVPDVPRITAATRPALWRLVGADGVTFCTAFAVRRNLVATSGRCVLAIETRQGSGKPVQVTGEAGTFPVARMWRHPETPLEGEDGGHDVGLVELAGEAAALVTLGSPEQMSSLREGSHLLIHGHGSAGVMAVPVEVESVGAAIEYVAGAPHGAPIFDASGVVVGVHAGSPTEAVGPGRGVRAEALLGLLAGLGR